MKAVGSNVTGVQGDVARLADLDRLYDTVGKVKGQSSRPKEHSHWKLVSPARRGKAKRFRARANLAKSHPALFQVGHEFEFDDYLEAIRDVFRPGKPESSY